MAIALLLTGCASTGADVTAAGGNPQEAARANTRLGLEYLRQGDFASAREKLERAARQDPNNGET
jgi:type IV pilus assembly protein PilF